MIDATIIISAIFDAASVVNSFLSADATTVYLMVLGLMVVESSFIPFPSEVIVPPAAYLAATTSEVNIWIVLLLATLGALIGALINYGLSVWIGRPIVYRFADSRIGHACMITTEKVQKAEDYFDRHGAVSTFIGRLVPVVRQLISIPAGLSRMNIGMFTIFTTLGAGVWNGALAGLGYWLGHIVSKDQLYQSVEKYNQYLSYIGLAIGVAAVAYIAWHALKNKQQSSNAQQ